MTKTKAIALSSLFLALGLILPFITGQIPWIGAMLLPIHIPVILCSLVCGPSLGMLIGIITPVLRSFLFSMPPFYPTALAMSMELGVYGLAAGLVYLHTKGSFLKAVCTGLLVSMIAGRLVYGAAQLLLLCLVSEAYSLQAYLSATVFASLPGILLQMVLIPSCMILLKKRGLLPSRKVEVNRIHA